MRRALFLLTLCASAVGAQGTAADSAHARAVRVVSDSIRAETCRGGTLSATGLTCAGATASARVTVLRRLANRLDSPERARLTAPPAPDTGVARVGVGFAWVGTVLYENPSGDPYPVPPADKVTVCGVIHWADSTYTIADPPIVMAIAGDSAWLDGVRDGTASMTTKCGPAFARVGLDPTRPTTPVTWYWDSYVWNGRTLWRPFVAVRGP